MKNKQRPPAYPQVEYKDECEEYLMICRHCGEKVDIPDNVTKKATIEHPQKFTHTCGNVFKIVWRENDN